MKYKNSKKLLLLGAITVLIFPTQISQAFSETADTDPISIVTLDLDTSPTNTSTILTINPTNNDDSTNTSTPSETGSLNTNTSTAETTTTTITHTSSTLSLFSTSTDPIDGDSTSTTLDNTTSTLETSTTTPNETPTTTANTSTTDTNTSNTSTDQNTTGGTNTSGQEISHPLVSSTIIQNTIDKILNFFRTNQSADGYILDGGTSGWVAMSFAANNTYSDTVKNSDTDLASALKQYNFSDAADLNLCAAYPRHILAFDALGDSRTTASTTFLIEKIKEQCFDNGIYGQNGINDDVFGLIALLAHNEPVNSTQIQTIISSIESDQTPDGAFTWAGYAGADITGATINSLIYARNRGATVKENSISRAKSYLKSTQLTDGGWGWGESDVLTTSWAVMGINALGEGQNDWFKDAKNPWNVLTEKIAGKEYYESAWAPGPDWFAMKHAVPALAGKTWPTIISQRYFAENPTNQNSASAGSILETNSTSTAPFATTTASTPKIDLSNTTTIDIVSSTNFVTSTIPEMPQIPTTSLKTAIETTKPQSLTKHTPKKIKPKTIAGNKISTSTIENSTPTSTSPESVSPPKPNTKKHLPGIIVPSTGLILTLSTLAWRKRRGVL